MGETGRGGQGLQRIGVLIAGLALASCSSGTLSNRIDPKYGVAASPRVVEPGQPVPKGGGVYRVGKPYIVAGRVYVPEENVHYRSEGLASWYGDDFHGRLTANGEIFDKQAISAAHPTLPMPCYVRVTNLGNRKSLIVRVNDRGPYHGNREIDLSWKAAELLGFHANGLARVRVEYVGPAPITGSDDRRLIATLRDNAPAPAQGIVLASARPLLSDAAGGGRGFRDGAPIPAERPFDLGERATAADAVATLQRGRSLAWSGGVPAAAPQARDLAPIGAPPRLTSPVAAYAAERSDGAAAVTSGRGLY
jgi:rare lipoprotein A